MNNYNFYTTINEFKLNNNVKIYDEVMDSHSGELFCIYYIMNTKTNEKLAQIDYSIYNGEYDIKYIESYKKNNGYAKKLMKSFIEKYGIENINFGYSTTEGTPFLKSVLDDMNLSLKDSLPFIGTDEYYELSDFKDIKLLKMTYEYGMGIFDKFDVKLINNLEKTILREYDIDVNELLDITKCIKGSKLFDEDYHKKYVKEHYLYNDIKKLLV